MSHVQILQRDVTRKAAWIANQGPSDIVMSLNTTDVDRATPIGVTIKAGDVWRMSTLFDGDLVTQIWWGNCTTSVVWTYCWIDGQSAPAMTAVPCHRPTVICRPIDIDVRLSVIHLRRRYGYVPHRV